MAITASQQNQAEMISVSQLNRYVASLLREDDILNHIYLRGEIANFKKNIQSGHCYFSLRDGEASVQAVMFSDNAKEMHFTPQNGSEVRVYGSVRLYERSGTYQIQVKEMYPFGIGAQETALRHLRKKLAEKGYFAAERKRKPPALPKKIGIVTSENAAALQDILNILRRRYPIGQVCLYPAKVQGMDAPQTIAKALEYAGADSCDVIILGRGGGSNEDLSAFQEEIVADAVFRSPVPVISAVGHEIDHSIADDVADLSVPTPSAAAELVAPDVAELLQGTEALQDRLTRAMNRILFRLNLSLREKQQILEKLSPAHRIELSREKLTSRMVMLKRYSAALLQKKQQEWQMAVNRLEAAGPLAGLRRGYALVYREQQLVRDAAVLHTGDVLNIRFGKGSATVRVTKTDIKEK